MQTFGADLSLDPVILIDLENPAATCWNKCSRSAAPCGGRIAMVRRPERRRLNPGFRHAGVFRLHRRWPEKERIKPILDLCISRFNAFPSCRTNSIATKSALEERKVIDRAKVS